MYKDIVFVYILTNLQTMFVDVIGTIEQKILELEHTILFRENERKKFDMELYHWCSWTLTPKLAYISVCNCKQKMIIKIPSKEEYLFGELLSYVNNSLTAYVFTKELEEDAILKKCKLLDEIQTIKSRGK